jgi:hypothetical protein
MAFVENLTPFFADFGTAATLSGSPLRAIVDTESVVEFDTVTQGPSALVKTSDSAAAAPNQTFVANAITYSVREVRRQPPDGLLTRLVLARS